MARAGQSSLTFERKGRVQGVEGLPPAQSLYGKVLVRGRLRRNRPRDELLRRLNGPAIGDRGCIFFLGISKILSDIALSEFKFVWATVRTPLRLG